MSKEMSTHQGNTELRFEPSSRNKEEVRISSSSLPQRTLSIQPRERLIDAGGKNPSTSKSSVSPRISRDSDNYRRSLRLACSHGRGDLPKREKDFTTTNGFHDDLPEQSVDEVPSRNPRAVGSYTSTYQVHEDDKRCSSDQSFWSSDYSTSVGGNSEKSNDSSDQGNANEHHLDVLKSKPQSFEEFLKQGTSEEKPKPGQGDSLQNRLRQRLSIFQNEHLVRHKTAGINSLPEHILLTILSYLSTKYLCLASGVCRKWYMLCWDPQLWRSMKISKYSGRNIDKVLSHHSIQISTEYPRPLSNTSVYKDCSM